MHDDEDDLEEETEEETEKTEEDLKLEQEFTDVVNKHRSEIEDQLKIASKAIAKAEKLSEKYGIPFYSNVSPLGQNYTPASFDEKFGELDHDMVYEIADIYPGGEYHTEGWEHSAVC